MKSRRYTRCPVAVLLVLGLLVGIGLSSVAVPATYPNCNWNCNANDVQVIDAWLELSSGECGCDPSDPTALTAELWVRLWNHTGTDRRDIAFVGDLYINNSLVQQLDGCTDPLPAGTTADLSLGQFQYRCGETVDLAEVVVSWVSSGHGTGCGTLDCPSRAAHCYGPTGLAVRPPLFVDAAISEIVDCRDVTITATATGAVGTVSYVWYNLPAGMTASGNTASGTLVDGTYSSPPNQIYVEATDERPCTAESNKIDPFTIDCGTTLVVGKSDSPDPVEVPDTLIYTITVENTGTADATNVIVSDELPDRVSYVSSSCPDCPGGTCSYSAGVVTCDIGTLVAGATATITVEVLAECPPLLPGQLVIDPASCQETISNTAEVTSDNADPDSFTVTTLLRDTTAPTFDNCPGDVTVECDAVPAVPLVTASDNCDISVSVTYNGETRIDGNCDDNYQLERTWTATDDCGNTATCTQTITVQDTTPPELTCPQDLTLECGDAGNEAAYLAWLASATATDNCSTPIISHDGPAFAGLPTECGPGVGWPVTWTATDDCGLQDTCSATVRILDTTAPVITTCPPAIEVDCGESVPYPSNDWAGFVTAGGLASDGCDTQLLAGYSDSFEPGCGATGVITRTWVVGDDCDLYDTCDQIITITDTTPPELTCPQDLTLECGDPTNQAQYVAWLASASATDDCSTPTVTHDGPAYAALQSECAPGTGTLVTWTATDACGQQDSCSATVRILDTSPPEITVCPSPIDLDCTEQIPYPSDDWGGFVSAGGEASDGCDTELVASYSDSFAPDCGTTGVITRTWTVTDDCGLSDTCDQTITITDTTPPELTCPQDLILECGDAGNEAAYLAWLASATATDDCSTPSVMHNGPAYATLQSECAPGSGLEVTWTATDDCQNEDDCSATVFLVDSTPPEITACPPALNLDCTETAPYPSNDWAGFVAAGGAADDGCDSQLTASYSDSETGPCPIVTQRTWTVTDSCGLTDTCVQTITVDDTTDPWFDDCPQDVTVECDSIPLVPTLTASDDCDLDVAVSYGGEQRIDGNCDHNYQLVRTWTAIDDCDNTATCTQTITVQDTTPPTIHGCPADVTVDCSNIPEPPELTASDNCDPVVDVIYVGETQVGGSCDGSYQLERTWTATDICGNTATCTQTITVLDTTPPTITCPQDLTLECGDPGNEFLYALWLGFAGASDDCSTPEVTHDAPPFGDLVTECEPGVGRLVTWTATDACGLQDWCSARVYVLDTTPPVITSCPPAIDLDCAEPIPYPSNDWAGFVQAGGAAEDVCDPTLVASYVDSWTSECEGAGVLTRTWTVTDECGLSATCGQSITVTDTTPPELTCPQDLTLECGDPTNELQYLAWLASASAADDCSTPDVTNNGPAFYNLQSECAPGIGTLVTWTATDGCGLQDTCSATVRILDTTPPEITTCPPAIDLDCAEPIPYPSNDWGGFAGAGGVANDGCDTTLMASYADSFAPDCGTTGVITRTWTVTDDCDLFDTCEQTITITDTTPPELTCPQEDLTLECGDPTNEAQYIAWLESASATDDCSTPDVTHNGIPFNDLQTECAPGTGYTVTWTATDWCGLQDTCSATVRVLDTTPPVITTCPPAIDLDCAEAIPYPSDDWNGFVNAGGAANDSCDTTLMATYSDSFAPDCGITGVITRTWTVTDDCDLFDTCEQTITITDTTPPELTCPQDLTLECGDPTNEAQYIAWLASASATDDCSTPSVTDDGLPFNDMLSECAPGIGYMVTWTATDACGLQDTCSAIVRIVDTTPPLITICPPAIDLDCTEQVPYPSDDWNGFASAGGEASDGCDTVLVASYSDSFAPDCGTTGAITRTWTVTDDCGLFDTCEQTITITDTTPPELTCPQDLTLECGDPTNEVQYIAWLESASATDDCSTPDVTHDGIPFNDLQTECDPGTGYTVTWTATDWCGLQDTCSATVRILDTTPPEITTCPPDQVLDCTEEIPIYSNDWDGFVAAGGAASDGCDTQLSAQFEGLGIGPCPSVLTLIWTVTDDCGLTDTCTQTITIDDTTPPTLTCPPDLTLECGDPTNEAQYIAWLASASAIDDCSDPIVTHDGIPFNDLQSECAPGTGVTVTWTALDSCMNQDQCSATVRILDRTPPEITTCPPDQEFDCSETVPLVPDTWDGFVASGGAASDGCDTQLDASYADVVVPGCGTTRTITRTWTVTDDCDLADTCVQTITVTDTTPPELTCPQDLTLECGDPTNESQYLAWLASASATDDCSTPTVTHDGPAFASLQSECAPGIGWLVTWTATDACGLQDTCSATVRILDTTPPVIGTCPGDLILDCTEAFPVYTNDWSGFVSAGGAASDGCDTELTASYAMAAIGPCPTVTTITWTVTDDCGLTDTCEQTITVDDTTPPDLTCPSDLTLECGAPGNEALYIAWLASASATDDCSTPNVTHDGIPFNDLQSECAPGSGVTVTWTATDGCENESQCSATVRILDRTPPAITTCPLDLSLDCTQSPPLVSNDWAGFVASGGAANDGCDTTLMASYTESFAPDCGNTGVITRTWTVTDDCGLTDTCDQTITITDTTPPDLTCPDDLTLECGALGSGTAYEVWLASASATDDCSTPTVTHDAPTFGLLPRECAPGLGVLVTWTATDACGNQSQCSATVRILDTTPPVITDWPDDVSVECIPDPDISLVEAFDFCSTPTITWEGDVADGTGCPRTITRTYRATDDCGLFDEVTQRIFIDDDTPPVIDCPPDIERRGSSIGCDLLVTVPPITADDCNIVSIFNDFNGSSNASGVYPVGTTVVNWTVIDECGNVSRCSHTVTVIPAEADLSVTKTVEEIIRAGTPESESFAYPGDTTVFTIVIRNTGETNLYDLTVEDPLLEYLSAPEEDLLAPDVLDVGEVWVLTGRHTVTEDEACAGRIVNTVRVTAYDPCDLELVALGSVDVDTAPNIPGLCDPVGGGGAATSLPIINEVAWSGTPYSSEHEWIELYNGTDETIDLDGWTLGWRHRRQEDEAIETITTIFEFRGCEPEDDCQGCGPEDECWEIPLDGSIFPGDFYLLERYVQEVVSDLDADLIYAELIDGAVYDPDAMRLSDLLGEELYLFDASGFVVSAANTDYESRSPGGIPWPAGTQLPASMERIEYFDLADLDEYWATNLGIVIYGLDAARALLTATARFPNEQAFMATLTGDPLYQLELRQGDPLTLMFDLQDWMVDYEIFPLVTIYGERIGVVEEDDIPLDEKPLTEIEWIPEDEVLGPHTYIHVLTEEFDPGEFTVFVTFGNGLTYRVDLVILRAEP